MVERKIPMVINLAKSAGFCFGVKRALQIALKTSLSGKKILMLGDIVHNEDVVKKIRLFGIKKAAKLTAAKDETLLIRAHGEPLDTFNKAKDLGYKIIDATCPMVKEIHRIAQEMEKKGYKIIVIGDRNHDEVRGIIGQLKERALVLDGSKNMRLARISGIKKACLVAQSTQNLEKVLKIAELLKKHIPKLEFFNTICKPTRTKQAEIKTLPMENDVIIIIGSKTSANTRRLYEISRSLNKKTWWINSRKDIKSYWFKNARSVGITAGASTPEETIKDITAHIRKISY